LLANNTSLPQLEPTLITRARASALLFGAATLGLIELPARAQTAAALKVMCAGPATATLDEIGRAFKKATGHDVAIESGGLDIPNKIAAGAAFDIVVTNAAALDSLIKGGFVLPDPRALVGVSNAALVYRSGTPKPDISTLDALKTVLLNAKSISFSDPAAGGTSSLYFAGLVQQIGISEDVKRKAILTKIGEGALPVGDGRAEIGEAQTIELALVPGVAGVPLFASDPKSKTTFAAGVSSKAADAGAALAFVKFMLAPEATAIRKAKGFAVEP
jgi:molybdate transport system substrate-binding protein